MAVTATGRQGDFFDKLETASREVRAARLERKLRKAVALAYLNTPAAREIMDRAGVKPGDIRSVRDLEKLPITRKTDLIEMQKARPPYGGFLAIPPGKVERVFISPGPIYEPLHTSRIKWFARAFYAAGFRNGDIVVNTFTYHLSPAGVLFHEALRDCRATVVVTGTGNTEVQLQAMRDLKVTGFVGTPSFLMAIIRKAEEMGYSFRRDYALKRAWFTGEMLPPSLRRTLEEDYHITTSQAYAVTEPGGALAYECPEKAGMHFMDDYVIEVVDPETGRQLGPGEIGEVVVTPIHNPAWGLIRFGTGDMSSYITTPCACGRTTDRLTGIMGRAADAVKVRGMFVVAKQAEKVILGFAPVARAQLVVGRSGERDEMVLQIELKEDVSDRAKLAEDLSTAFQSVCRVKPDRVEFVGKGQIPEGQPLIADRRVWK